MSKKPNEFPLTWPSGWPRTAKGKRKRGQFRSESRNAITYFAAEKRVIEELKRLGGTRTEIICSSNMIRDRQPDDPGAAVYFQAPEKPQRVIAVDIYDRVEDNLAAVAATIEAMRAIERHGGATILERAFTGFDALPAPKRPWQILGVGEHASEEAIDAAFRSLAKQHHPDKNGGSDVQFKEITEARDVMMQARGK